MAVAPGPFQVEAMTRLKRRRPDRMGVREDPRRARVCEAHRRFVRGFDCAVAGLDCEGRIEFAHVRRGTDGGTGLKPSDEFGVALCAGHHRLQHQIGEAAFERRFYVDLLEIAEALAKRSPALKERRER